MTLASFARGTTAAAAVAAVGAVLLMTGPEQAVPRVAAVCALAVLSFALRLLPEAVTGLLCFLAFLALGAAPAEVIFSGFATGGFWLLFSGLIIGTAITQTGLGGQIARRLFARSGSAYWRAALVLALMGLGLGLLVPSTMPRIIVVMPVAVSLAAALGFETGSRGQIGLALTAATSTLLPTYGILTANLPTIVQSGALEALYGVAPSYAGYALAQAPVNLVRLGVLLAVLLPFARSGRAAAPAQPAPEPMTPVQLRLLGLLGVAILFWATDRVHGIGPAWVALALAAVLLWPGAGMLPRDAMKGSIDLSPTLFLAGIFAVSGVARHVGLDAMLAEALIPRLGLGEGGTLRDLAAITGSALLVSHLATAPAAPVVLAPLAGAMAEATGWPVEAVGMAQIIGIATPLLPYQAPPLIVAMALAHMPAGLVVRVCLAVGAGVAFIGVPLTALWWQAIGLI